MTNHEYSDKELSKRILKLAEHDISNLTQIESTDNRCLQFTIEYAMEGFLRDLLEVHDNQAVGWFIKNGILNVYRSNNALYRSET